MAAASGGGAKGKGKGGKGKKGGGGGAMMEPPDQPEPNIAVSNNRLVVSTKRHYSYCNHVCVCVGYRYVCLIL